MFYVTTFVKTALSCGLVAGVGDSLYQAVNSRRYSKKTIKFTWDASRSCKVALAGAMAGPVIATPYILVARWTMHRAIATGLGLAFTECFFLPFVWMWKEDYLSSGFKRFLPIIVVGGGATTVLLTSFFAAFTGHFSSFGSLLSLGNLLPEGVVFSIGVGISSFALYGFIFQQGLNAVSDFPREMLPLITSTQTLGMLGVIGLFTCGMFPPSYMPFVNMIGADVLYLTSVLYQCCLTYEYYSLQRYQELSPHEDALKKLRTLINLVTVVSSFLVGPFNATSHTIIASELQISAYGSWMLYFATFYDEFGDLLNGEPAIAEDEELVKPSSKLKRKKGAKITEISDEEEVDAKKKEAGEASEDENCEPNKPDSVTYQGKYGSWALSEEPAFDFTQETTTLDADFFAAFISPAVPQEEEPFKFEEAEETSVPVIEEADLDEETDVQTALPVSPVPAIPAPAPQALPTPVPEPAAKPQVVESQNNLQSALPLTPATKQELPLAPPAPPAPQAAPSSPATAVEQKPIAPREQKQPVNPEPKPLVSPTKASISPVNAMENAAEPLERPIVKLAPASPRAVSDKPQGELQALFPRPVLPAVVTKPKPSTQIPEQLPIPASQQAAPQEKTEQAPTTTVSPVPTAGDTAAVSENSDTSLLPQAEPIKELVNEPAPTDADEAPQSQYMSTVYLPSGKYNASRVQVKTPNKKAGKKRR